MLGKYTEGRGQAHRFCFNHDNLFNCRMIGTFNIDVPGLNLLSISPSLVNERAAYWLVQIKKDKCKEYGWAVRDFDSRQRTNRIELLTKRKLPKHFKKGNLEVCVYEPLKIEEVEKWASRQYWYQTFPCTPTQKADSLKVWNTINKISWSGKSVLDIGSHYGFFSWKASEQGSYVTSFEPDKNCQRQAEFIQQHIHPHDSKLVSEDPGGNYDVILYLSVHHQPDEEYDSLPEKIRELKERTNQHLFIELIMPPLFPKRKNMTKEQIDRIVQANELITYKHNVRGHRTIYQWSKK